MNLLLPLIVCFCTIIAQFILMMDMRKRHARLIKILVDHTRAYAKSIVDSNDRLMQETIKILPKDLADTILGNWELGRAAAEIEIDKMGKDVHKQNDDLPSDPV